jgi:kinetochore protein NDC80
MAKDPRPIKDKRFQQNAIQKLIQFLMSSGYPQGLSPKSFQSPSSKDFQSIFKFLYSRIDPSYNFDQQNRKFEEEVPSLLRGIRYPFADQINKSNLFTVGSLHAWPVLLAMLIWMVELIISIQELELAEENNDLDDNQQAERMFFEYLSKAYTTFLNSIEESSSDIIDRPLFEKFEEKDSLVKRDLDTIERDLQHFGKEWELISHSEVFILDVVSYHHLRARTCHFRI